MNIAIYKTLNEFSKMAKLNYKKYKNPISCMDKLFEYINNNNRFVIVDLKSLLKYKTTLNKIAIRCDVDCDIDAAIKMSKYFYDLQIRATFYILHSAYYYCYVNNKYIRFGRHDELKSHILQISNTWCSIGLHLDPLEFYITNKEDGTAKVIEEIEWLRTFVPIESVVAHNSYAVYGAENFEIFEELTNRKNIIYNNINIPLGTIKLNDLNLIETNFPIIKKTNYVLDKTLLKRDRKDIFREYFLDNPIFSYGYDINIWPIDKNEWIICNHITNYFDIVSLESVINFLENIGDGLKIVLNLHSEYFDDINDV
jgi:hypothetical protein